jgi:DsbC/DsbD-like thiol-disulfide interchange protein
MPDREDLFVRTRSSQDGALPSANSMMAHNLLDLYETTGEEQYLDDAVALIESLSMLISQVPRATELTTLAVHRVLEKHPERLGQSAAAATPGIPSFGDQEKIKFSTSTRTLKLSQGTPASVEVTVELARGWHVNANKPGIDFLIPLEIVLVGATGVEIEVDYPAGEVYEGPEGRMLVHNGKVTIPVRVTQTGTVSGRPQLVIKYQICDDKMCLAPEEKRLPVGLIPGS